MLDRQRDRGGPEPVRGGRERHRRPRRILLKDVEDDLAFERVVRMSGAVLGEPKAGAIENGCDLVVGQRIDGEKVHERCAYCGGGRLASASIVPCRICAAASASTFSARLARLTSAEIIARSTACVDQRSSQRSIGRSSGERLRAKARTDCVRGLSVPSMLSGSPITKPIIFSRDMKSSSAFRSCVNLVLRIVSAGPAKCHPASQIAKPIVFVPTSSPASLPPLGRASAN